MIIEDILIKAGVDYKQQRDEFIMPCPFCAGQHDTASNRRVFGINLNTGFAHCYRCDWGSKSLTYTVRTLCETFDLPFDLQLRLSAGAEEAERTDVKADIPKPTALPDEYEKFIGSDDLIERKARRYLKQRGIGRDLIKRYHIGFAAAGKFAWRIIIPVIGEDGITYGCVGRDFSGKAEKKYLNPEGTKILWGLDVATDETETAVVQEGVIDSLRANMRLYPRYGDRVIAVACLGAAITVVQVEQLQRFKRALHFPDFDEPGVVGMMRRADKTDEAGIETMVVLPEKLTGEDPDSLSEESYIRHLRAAVSWGPAARLKLQMLLITSAL